MVNWSFWPHDDWLKAQASHQLKLKIPVHWVHLYVKHGEWWWEPSSSRRTPNQPLLSPTTFSEQQSKLGGSPGRFTSTWLRAIRQRCQLVIGSRRLRWATIVGQQDESDLCCRSSRCLCTCTGGEEINCHHHLHWHRHHQHNLNESGFMARGR